MRHDLTRKSARLSCFDYSTPGAYFITINACCRKNLFGRIRNGTSCPSELGSLITGHWNMLPCHYPSVELDEFIVMPNHVHGIILIKWESKLDKVGAASGSLTDTGGCCADSGHQHAERSSSDRASPPLTQIINGFKSGVTREYRRLNPAWQGSVWNRSFYDHVIRNEDDLYECRKYIRGNPLRRSLDP